MFSGTTKNGRHKVTDVGEHSGLLQIDFDKVAGPATLRDLIGKDRHILAAWISPSGDGVKALMRIPPDLDRHKDASAAAKAYIFTTYPTHASAFDGSTSDVSRLCFVSHDPDLVINFGALPLDVPVKLPRLTTLPPSSTGTCAGILEQARAYLSKMPASVSGQHGHDAAFIAAVALIRGFNLSKEQAYPLLLEWNDRCVPPWSYDELWRKLSEAETKSLRAVGYLLGHVHAQADQLDLSLLDTRRIDLSVQYPKPVPVYSFVEQQICTAGNLTVISAQAKAGKSAVVSAMVAAAISAARSGDTKHERDFLGFTSVPNDGKAVVLFDTEQSRSDASTLAKRAILRAGAQDLPENFRMYSVVDLSSEARRAYLAAEMERASELCGGLHSVFIDGVADLCTDPNDFKEACLLVEELVQLATLYSCPIILVLHENPGSAETGKTRGHLGSQLERKAESNLRVMKDGKGVSIVFGERCRKASIPKDKGQRFEWSSEFDMHITIPAETRESEAEKKRREHQLEVEAIFEGIVGIIRHTELKKQLMNRQGVSSSTAERRIKTWHDLGLIRASSPGRYYKPSPSPSSTVKSTVSDGTFTPSASI